MWNSIRYISFAHFREENVKFSIFHLQLTTTLRCSVWKILVMAARFGESNPKPIYLPFLFFPFIYLFIYFCTGFLLRKIKQHTSDQILWVRQHSLMEMFWPENFEIMKLLKARIANYLIYADPFTDFPKKHSKFSNFFASRNPFLLLKKKKIHSTNIFYELLYKH